jgi:hypothetical protein
VIGEDHFSECLIVSQGESAWITAGVCLLHQFEVANHMLVIQRITMKLFEQVEGDVRFVLHQRITNHVQLIVKTDGINFVSHLLQS